VAIRRLYFFLLSFVSDTSFSFFSFSLYQDVPWFDIVPLWRGDISSIEKILHYRLMLDYDHDDFDLWVDPDLLLHTAVFGLDLHCIIYKDHPVDLDDNVDCMGSFSGNSPLVFVLNSAPQQYPSPPVKEFADGFIRITVRPIIIGSPTFCRASRTILADYCIQDARLPQQLIDAKCLDYLSFASSQVTGIPLRYYFERGQQVRVYTPLYHFCKEVDTVVPYYKVPDRKIRNKTFEGATVQPPIVGFYTDVPIVTVDFMSLYPTIIIGYNICYSTKIALKDIPNDWVVNVDYVVSPIGICFVSRERKSGILPLICEKLLASRKVAKEKMFAAEKSGDSLGKETWNAIQIAVKVICNSIFGFTGAIVGKLPDLELSGSITSYGRQMIQLTKEIIEREWPGSVVIYGDTV
jgi:hypothetical protein